MSGTPTRNIAEFEKAFLARQTSEAPSTHPASTYILSLFKPDDPIAIMLLRGEEVIHWFASAQEVASPRYLAKLQKKNQEGFSVYVCMNPLHGGKRRVKENVTEIRTAYLDIDANGEAAIEKISKSPLLPKPHFILESSPGKFYVIWSVDGIQPSEQETLNKAMIQEFGGDPAASDMVRVLRLPGFVNCKPEYESKPVVQIVENNFDGDSYTRADFKIGVNPVSAETHTPFVAPDEIHEGEGRNNAMMRLASSLRAKNLADSAVYAAVVEQNRTTCRPPLEDNEIKTVVKSALRPEYKAKDAKRRQEKKAPSSAQTAYGPPPTEAVPGKKIKNPGGAQTPIAKTRIATLTRGDKVKMRKVPWLWNGRLVADGLNTFYGEGGEGKSTCAADTVARITRGQAFADGAVNELGPKDVLIICDEDGREDTIAPRLTLAGADMTRVWFLNIEINNGLTIEQAGARLDEDLPAIEEQLRVHPDIVLIIPDPVKEYLGDANPNLDQEVGPIYTKMLQVSKRHRVAWLLISHFNKDRQATSQNRNSGAKCMITKPRCNWLFTDDPHSTDGRKLMLQGKCNLMKRKALAYYIKVKNVEADVDGEHLTFPDITMIHWNGETDDQADDVLLSMADPKDRTATKVKMFLDDLLVEGPRRAAEGYALAEQQQISADALKDNGLRGVSKTQIQSADGHNEWWWAKTKLELDDLRKRMSGDHKNEVESSDDSVKAFLDGTIGDAAMPVTLLKSTAEARSLNWETVKHSRQRYGYESATVDRKKCWRRVSTRNTPVPAAGDDTNAF